MQEQVKSFEEWRKSDQGRKCEDWTTLAMNGTHADFLRNRIYHAFHAGYKAGSESQGKSGSQESK